MSGHNKWSQIKEKKGKTDAKKAVSAMMERGERVPGFGHRLYTKDSRAELIMESTGSLGFSKKYTDIARAVEGALAEIFKERSDYKNPSGVASSQAPAEHAPGKVLPLNIDGAIAAALCTIEWKPEVSTAVFIAARSAGLCAHHLQNKEEQEKKTTP